MAKEISSLKNDVNRIIEDGKKAADERSLIIAHQKKASEERNQAKVEREQIIDAIAEINKSK